jgi:hypothetical protein
MEEIGEEAKEESQDGTSKRREVPCEPRCVIVVASLARILRKREAVRAI